MAECNNSDHRALIHAYELGLLRGDELDRFEAHVLECRSCFEELVTLEEVAQALRSGAALQRMLGNAGQGTDTDTERVVRPGSLTRTFLAAAAAVILLMIYPAWLGLRTLETAPAEDVQCLTILPLRGPGVPTLSKSGPALATLTIVFRAAQPGASYHLRIERDGGERVVDDPSFGPFDEFGSAPVLIRLEAFDVGTYRIMICESGGELPPLQEYPLKVAP